MNNNSPQDLYLPDFIQPQMVENMGHPIMKLTFPDGFSCYAQSQVEAEWIYNEIMAKQEYFQNGLSVEEAHCVISRSQQRRYAMTTNPHSSPRERPERQSRLRLACSLVISAIFLSFLLASCKPPQPTDPISVVQTAYERLNKGDVDGFMEFASDDIVIIDPRGRTAGRQAVRDLLKSLVVEGTHRFEISNLSRDGNIVNYDLDVYVANQLVDSGKGLDVVVDGLIVFEGVKGSLLYECERDPSQVFCPKK